MRFKPFYPGVWAMRRMRLPTKLGLLALLLLIPLAFVFVQWVQRIQGDAAFTRAELDGVVGISEVSGVAELVQKQRDLALMVGAGTTGARPALDATREELGRALGSVTARLAGLGIPGGLQEWTETRQRIEGLPRDLAAAAAESSSEAHGVLVDDLRRLVYTLGERSGLLFDPQAAPYFLMDMMVSRTLPWRNQISQLRGLAASQPLGRASDEAILTRIHLELDGLAQVRRDIRFSMGFLARHGQSDLPGEAALTASAAFEALVRDAYASGVQRPASNELFDAGTGAMDAVTAYQTGVQQRLQALLDARLSRLGTQWWLAVGAITLGISLLMYLLVAFYLSFVIDFRHALDVMRQTAGGNLTAHVHIRGNDELAQMSQLLEDMIWSLSAMVADIRSNSALVAHSGHSLAAGNRDLAERTEQQAANLEQTAASVQQLSGIVEQNASAAGTADARAGEVRDVAEQGAQAMQRAVTAVEGIQESTARMNEIIGVIDGLAFQTNILALNAAVAAARAGEQGRGFAVVATEVRRLAQRSAESAREIRSLIQASTTQVAASVQQIRAAGGGVSQVVDGIRGVAANMSQISTASSEQSAGLGEISTAVAELAGITQRNAQMVERAVAQANSLETRAAQLAKVVSSFKLQQGTAEEAIALVERALAHRRVAAGDVFLRDVTDSAQGFYDRDMYVFVLNAEGTYLAFGGNPAKVRTRVQDIPGIDGDELVAKIVQQAKDEPGWVEYGITNPQTGTVQTKMSYVCEVDGLYMGCGIYKSLQARKVA